MDAAVKLFWQPGCTSCLRTKEFLVRKGVRFQSVNVHDDEAGREELLRLGARSVPVVAKGERFVFAQVLDDVAKFLGIDFHSERLPPAVLVERLEAILASAEEAVRALPEAALERTLPGRSRSYRALGYHVFRIPEAFLDALDEGATLLAERVNALPPDEIRTGDDIARYGAAVRARLARWWASGPDPTRPVETYYGSKPLHLVLERTAWHSAQHTRQLEMVLGMLGVPVPRQLEMVLGMLGVPVPRPLAPELLQGLPVPEDVWG